MPAMTPFKPGQSDGTLPNIQPAKLFQYAHYINWDTSQTWNAGLGKEGKGKWHIQLIDPSGRVIFEQTVTITITVIFFGFELVWYYYSGVGEKYETTVINGQPITDTNTAWSHTIGNTINGEQGNMIPGGDDVPAYGGEGIVSAVYHSPVYVMDIPVGTKLHVISDNWGLGVQVRPEWQWSFLYGGNTQASYFDNTTGMTWQGFVENGKTVIQTTRRMSSGLAPERTVLVFASTVAYMRIFRMGASIYTLVDNSGLELLESRDDGQTWIPVMDIDTDVKVLFAVPADDGGQVYIYGTANAAGSGYIVGDLVYLIVARDGDGFKTRKVGKILTEDMPKENITGLDYANGALLLSVNNNGKVDIYQSTDEMQNWTALNNS